MAYLRGRPTAEKFALKKLNHAPSRCICTTISMVDYTTPAGTEFTSDLTQNLKVSLLLKNCISENLLNKVI